MAQTIRERTAAFLQSKGYQLVKQTEKRWILQRPNNHAKTGKPVFAYLGSHGAWREGMNYQTSVARVLDTEKHKQFLAQQGF